MPIAGLKQKDLVGIPWRVALALQAPYQVAPVIGAIENRAWLAALIDGEGCIGIRRHDSYSNGGNGHSPAQDGFIPYLTIGNNDIELLDRCVEITGEGSVKVKDHPGRDSRGIVSRRTYYGWRLDGNAAIRVIRAVYPYLIAKRKQAVIAYSLDISNKGGRVLRGNKALPQDEQSKRVFLWQTIKACNQRQGVDLPEWCEEPRPDIQPGWYLRSDIIWSKPNPMPESIKDRPTKAHEYIFLLAKSERYFYNADAIREPHTYGEGGGHHRNVLTIPESHAPGAPPHTGLRKTPKVPSGWDQGGGAHTKATGRYKTSGPGPHVGGRRQAPEPGEPCAFHPLGRNKRSVWSINTQPFPGSHFATFPEEIPRLCILAGSRPGDVILDPFGGSGTTGKVALELGRRAVHIDLTYHDLARKRMTTTPAMAGLMGK